MQGLPAIPVLHIHAHTMVQEELGCPQVSIGPSDVQLKERKDVNITGGWGVGAGLSLGRIAHSLTQDPDHTGASRVEQMRWKYQPCCRGLVSLQYRPRS